MRRSSNKEALLVGALGFAAVLGLGFWGWRLEGSDPAEGLYRSLQALTLSDIYNMETLQAPTSRPFLEGARWVGVFLAFYAVVLLLWSSLERRRLGLWARIHRGHLAVVGDTNFADRLCEAASGDDPKSRVVQARAPGQPILKQGRLIRIPSAGFDHGGLDEVGAQRARRLVIALEDDGVAVDLALSAQRRYPNLSILTRLKDSGLLRSLYELSGGETLRAFSEAGAAAREVVRRHPPLLLAQDRGQARIHALLIGDDDWVEALMTEIILSSRTLGLEKPRLTLAVVESESLRRRISDRYPELAEEAHLVFTPLAPETLKPAQLGTIQDITVAYVALAEGAPALTAALDLRREALSWPRFDAPIFVRASGGGLARPRSGTALSGGELVPFGSLTDVINAAGVLSETTDKAEREWHEAYLRLNPASEAAVPWEKLNEDYRLSNRRAVAHIYAKLHEAGFDLRPWLARAKPWDELPALAPGEALFRNDEELVRLAELEHERWNADRRLLGWRYGPIKDQARKVHPCLVDFADLPPDIRQYDVELIRALDRMLPRRRGGLKRP